MAVAVIVPYRGDDGGPRDRAWAYVRRWWSQVHPGWQVIQGDGHLPPGPWVKADAVRDALAQTDAPMICVADADCLSVGIGRAVEAVLSGQARWAIPHYKVYRLTAAATDQVLAGRPLPPPPAPGTVTRRRHASPRIREWRAPDFDGIHVGAEGGGLVVLPRALYEEVPLDPRFRSWGQEDNAWGNALRVIAGPPARPGRKDPDTPIFHLYHDPPPRIYPSDAGGEEVPWGRIDRAHGNPAGMALRARYRAATTPEAMRALLAEIPGHASAPAEVAAAGADELGYRRP